VWFRAWTEKEAKARGLDGWVRNRRDGSVEAVFAGTAEDIERMLALCREGPPLAQVDKIDCREDESELQPGFRQLPTA
jgi:acylphosphatase